MLPTLNELSIYFTVGTICWIFGFYFQKIETNYWEKLAELRKKEIDRSYRSYDELKEFYLNYKIKVDDYIFHSSNAVEYYKQFHNTSKSNIIDINERRKKIKLVKPKPED